MPIPTSTPTSAPNKPVQQQDDFLKMQDLFFMCLSKWKWFIYSFVLTLGVATIYLLTTPPVYTREALILIKDQSKGQSVSNEVGAAFSDMGLIQSSSNVHNELISFRSSASMYEVVKRLHLEVNYLTDGSFYKKVLYGETLPYIVQFLDLEDMETAAFTLRAKGGQRFVMTDLVYNKEEWDDEVEVCLNDTVSTPMGRILLTKGASPVEDEEESTVFYIHRNTVLNAATSCLTRFTAALSEKQATVIQLSYQDVNIQRAEDVLNMIISVYNERWVKDKNQIAISTSIFINERLGVIEQELGHVDQDISSYKSAHLLPDVQAVSGMYMSQSDRTAQDILTMNTQLSMAAYIRNFLIDAVNSNQLLPANTGLEGTSLESRITEYNTLQLQRNSLVASSSEKNPLVRDLDENLKALRVSIISTVDNLEATLKARLKALERHEEQTNARIAANPTQAKYLLSVERQQKVKEALYLFLLQKREENELSQAFTAYNTRIITPPSGSMLPTSPVTNKIYLVALVLGLLLPIGVVYMQENLNTRVRGRKDLEQLTLPFVGEIPLSYRKKRSLIPWKKQPKEEYAIVVKDKSRNVINEAFRVVRTNLEFMLGKESGSKVIMTSSMNPGSGKTFICMNLATALAIKGKKVLTIDLDLRRASLSSYVGQPKPGIADYLGGQIDDRAKIVVRGQTHPNVDMIPVGTMPPNPTELLFSDRMVPLLEQVRKEYDYIFIDCPPVEIVADASIINKWVDLTLFIVRSEVLDRSMLPQIESFYTEHKYRNLSLLLNGTQEAYNRYGYHKYGYRYGYHYGYGSYGKEEQ